MAPRCEANVCGFSTQVSSCGAEQLCSAEFGAPACIDRPLASYDVERQEIALREMVFFETGTAQIDERSFGLLADVAALLIAHPEITKIEIEGHTDNVGSQSMNRRLSQERADAVKTFLFEQGIEEARMSAVGFGPDKPIASNDSEEGRAQNRRVLLRVVDRE